MELQILCRTSCPMFCRTGQPRHLSCISNRARPARTLAGRYFACRRRRVGAVPESQRSHGGRAHLVGDQQAWPRRPAAGLRFLFPSLGELNDDRNFTTDAAGPMASSPRRPTPPYPAPTVRRPGLLDRWPARRRTDQRRKTDPGAASRRADPFWAVRLRLAGHSGSRGLGASASAAGPTAGF